VLSSPELMPADESDDPIFESLDELFDALEELTPLDDVDVVELLEPLIEPLIELSLFELELSLFELELSELELSEEGPVESVAWATPDTKVTVSATAPRVRAAPAAVARRSSRRAALLGEGDFGVPFIPKTMRRAGSAPRQPDVKPGSRVAGYWLSWPGW
jgi:hypothetical protein